MGSRIRDRRQKIEPGSRDRYFVALVVLGGIGALIPCVFIGLPDSVALLGGERVLAGQTPYRDFWTMYAPGQFYLAAALFGIFGRHVLVTNIAAVLLIASAGGALFALLRKLNTLRPTALFAAGLITLSFWSTPVDLSTYPPALLCLLLSLNRLIDYLHAGRARSLLAAGAYLGLAACFKHDIAAYTAAASAAALVVARLLSADRRTAQLRSTPVALGSLVVGALTVFTPVAVFIALTAGPDAWTDIFVFPATDFRGVRSEAYPPLLPDLAAMHDWLGDWKNVFKARGAVDSIGEWLRCNAPLWTLALGISFAVFRGRRIAPPRLVSFLLFLVLLPLFLAAAHVQRNTHVYSMAICSCVLLAVIHTDSYAMPRCGRWIRTAVVAVTLTYATGLLARPIVAAAHLADRWAKLRSLDLPGTRGVFVWERDHRVLAPIAAFIRANTAESERIYVGLARHDAIVISAPIYYFLSQRRNCSRYDELHPGVADRGDVQREIIDGLAVHRVRCVVLWRFGWPADTMERIKARNAAAVPGAGSTNLDRYIRAHFHPLKSYGEFTIFWRNDAPPPAHTPGA